MYIPFSTTRIKYENKMSNRSICADSFLPVTGCLLYRVGLTIRVQYFRESKPLSSKTLSIRGNPRSELPEFLILMLFTVLRQ